MNKQRVVAGIDAGSTAIKITLYDGFRFESWLCPTGWSPRESAEVLLKQATERWSMKVDNLESVFGTGYGRVSMPFLTKSLTEISCHAKGAVFLTPGVKTVVDLGGQDAKAIRINAKGKVADFIMNDKCAAGTGRFLQVMAGALGLDLAEMGQIETAPDRDICPITAMCTVFAESEVIGLLHKGYSREAIVAGLYKSIASRISTMTSRVDPHPPLVFTGGISRNLSFRKALEVELGMPLIVPKDAIFAGSIGAALYAWEEF